MQTDIQLEQTIDELSVAQSKIDALQNTLNLMALSLTDKYLTPSSKIAAALGYYIASVQTFKTE